MEGGGHADNRGGLPHQGAHGVLPFIHVSIDLGQRAVIPDGAHQHVRNVVAHALVDNAVLRLARLHEGGGGAAQADGIEGVDVVIVAVWHALLGVDVLAQGGAEVAGLQIVGGQCVARQQAVDIPAPHQGGESRPGVVIEGTGRPHHPQDAAMLLLVAEQLIDGVVVHGIGGLPGAALAECKGLRLPLLLGKAEGIDIDALGGVLRAAHRHRLAGLQVAKLHRGDLPVPQGGHAVHAALLSQQPPPPHLEILRIDGGGVVALRSHPILGGRLKPGLRRALEPGLLEVGLMVLRQGKAHKKEPLSSFFCPILP
ncbi:Uncharacterised protein [Flavonifractor plautii]|nr:Uncharacterised protein [Flavonifractor plautii]